MVIDEIKKLDVLISKKMFSMAKYKDNKFQPSPLQFRILDYLLQNQNLVICQRDLENHLNVSKATISEVLLTMEKSGIIIRNSSQTDARSKNIKLTDTSLNRFREMQNVLVSINKDLIQNVSEEDLNIFLMVLEKMKLNLQNKD